MRLFAVPVIAGAILALAPSTPLFAQQYGRTQDGFFSGQYSGQYSGGYIGREYGRPQDGFVSGQYSGQYSGRYNGRVDGRVSRNEGFPPSAADKYFHTYAVPIPVDPIDCIEVESFAPDVRPYWQSRIRYACQ
jgi:hypothetical protein